MTRKFFYLVLGYFIATMLTAYPWHILFFHDKYQAMGAMTRIEPIMPFGMLAVLLQGIVFAYLFPIFCKYKKEGPPLVRGVHFSLLMGVTVWSVMVFATVAKFKIAPVLDFITLGTAFQLIQFFAVGLTFGLIHKFTAN